MSGARRHAGPELVVAGVAVTVLAASTYAFAGTQVAMVMLTMAGALALASAWALTPADDPLSPADQDEAAELTATTFTGFWRRRSEVRNAMRSMRDYDSGLRATLQHLLAARLAERHGVSLWDDPEQARRILESGAKRPLWHWLDPAGPPEERPEERTDGAAGIPRRTLADIIDRLERL